MADIREANDEELRMLIHTHDKVIVKFVDEQCEICKILAPKFVAMADNEKYKGVLFLRIDAKENPVSSKEVKISGTPFFAVYNNGRLIECGLVKEEEGVHAMLQHLLNAS